MVALDVDFEVFKALTNRRATESVTYNDVIRELLGLGKNGLAPTPAALSQPRAALRQWREDQMASPPPGCAETEKMARAPRTPQQAAVGVVPRHARATSANGAAQVDMEAVYASKRN
jgi:hypothetical protein